MNTYERLQEEACEDGIEVVDYTFESDRIKGLYCDGVVAIKKRHGLYTESVYPGRRDGTSPYIRWKYYRYGICPEP